MSLELIAAAILLLLILCVVLQVLVLVRNGRSPAALNPEALRHLETIEGGIGRFDQTLNDQFGRGREESAAGGKLLREEITASFGTFADTVRKNMTDLAHGQKAQLDGFGTTLGQLKSETATNAQALREELLKTLKELGDGVGTVMTTLSEGQARKLDDVAKQVGTLIEGTEKRQEALKLAIELKLAAIATDSAASATLLKDEIGKALHLGNDALVQTLNHMSDAQRERLTNVTTALDQLTQQNATQQEALKLAVEGRLDQLRTENAAKLDEMRQTVDEKLQGTLEQRLGSAFKQVSDQLEQVYKSVGEMQALAIGVGDLKKVLTNVKSRGTWGEVALGNLLEQVLAPDQYSANVEVRPGSGLRVEFAIKLPGDGNGPLWLPIDAKFPVDDYERLVDAAERGDLEGIDAAGKGIEKRIRDAALDISQKYIHPPHSTDFGVLFLPTEGLFAEVIRRPGLVDAIHHQCRIVIAGPTTLAAFLNSMRMGFKTLAIQKRSSEVWQVLGAVKTEFTKYGDVMEKVQKKLHEASNQIDQVTVRQRAIDRKLRSVETIPELEAKALLEIPLTNELESENV